FIFALRRRFGDVLPTAACPECGNESARVFGRFGVRIRAGLEAATGLPDVVPRMPLRPQAHLLPQVFISNALSVGGLGGIKAESARVIGSNIRLIGNEIGIEAADSVLDIADLTIE